jgi:hypothetical protein
MAIVYLTRPCWINRREFTLHAGAPDRLPAPAKQDGHHRLPHCCVHAACDRCGIPASSTEVQGVDGADHFPNRDVAAYWLTAAGWTTDNAGRWHCPDCPVPFALTPAAHVVLQHAA